MEFPVNIAGTHSLRMVVLVLQFIGLLLNTWLRYSLGKGLPYRSIMELLDDFHTVPCAPSGTGTCTPAPFSESQKATLSALGLL